MTALAYETYYLGIRTTRRFIRVPANVISILFFPLVQLLVFSQLYEDIVQLPGFAGDVSYLAYLAPGQIVSTAFFAVAWAGFGLLMEIRSGYTDKLRASPIHRWSILASEMVPLFFQAAAMSGGHPRHLRRAGHAHRDRHPWRRCSSWPWPACSASPSPGRASSRPSSPRASRRRARSRCSCSRWCSPPPRSCPVDLMPEWMQVVNTFNPITYVIEAIRALMVTGYDWEADRPGPAVDRDRGRHPAGRHPVGLQPRFALT